MADVNVKEYVRSLVQRAKAAQKEFERTVTDQLTIDKVVRAVGKTIYDHREELAKDACEETKYGTVEMKINKILASTPGQWNVMRGKKSVGYIANLRDEPGVKVMAKPMGGCWLRDAQHQPDCHHWSKWHDVHQVQKCLHHCAASFSETCLTEDGESDSQRD